ncbi:MAG: cell division protein [Pseudobdellovibrionaceae bacterium]|nr:cell division protein [Bdellovibrionales bacterium]USN46399.1 MAG: cell division protein [Pseudobdellovibrionaceae bacterium]
MNGRIVVIFVGFLALWSIVIVRAINLQLLPDEKLNQLRSRQFKQQITLNSRRGTITDRQGKELAITIPTHSLFADPKLIGNPMAVSQKLARYLQLSKKNLYRKIKDPNRRFVWIKRHLSEEQKTKINSWKEPGLAFIDESMRVYPNDRLLSQVMGFVNIDGRGLEGLELKYNKSLAGEGRALKVRRDARGRPLIRNGRWFTDQPEGSSLQLTIDSELQFVLERELEWALEKHDADGAVGVILDATTSEILAIANAPSFNLNLANQYGADIRRNKSVTDAFEPGSTIKTFVVAGSLKKGLSKPNSKYNCENGQLKIGRRTIGEADSTHKFEWLTVSEILAKSSNVGITKMAFELGDSELLKVLKDFGFGQMADVDLPGESAGVLQALPWRPHLLSNIAFGHGMTATPLQVANAYAAIANGGTLNKPYIVKSIVDPESGDEQSFEPEKIRQVLPQSEAAMLRLMLTGVTAPHGTGFNARVPGFPVAGKTGTAQKVNPTGRGYLPGGYVSSFAGFIPANEPKFVIYIAVDHPREEYYGSTVAAPIFSKVANYAVRKAGLSPIILSEKDVMGLPDQFRIEEFSKVSEKSNTVVTKAADTVPPVLGMSLREALRHFELGDKKLKINGQGVIQKTSPATGESFAKAKTIQIWLGETDSLEKTKQ